ncbi:MAG: hypothetical protein K2J99_12255 [Lachnospiraceae bacterium]|nr:hypothetical protein [Lachnospiraceae bacterium]
MRSFCVIAKQLLGARYESVTKSLLTCFIIFSALYAAGIRVEVAPFIFFLTATLFSMGVMWRSLGSARNAEIMQGLFMLPFDNKELVVSYLLAFGSYTLITKTLLVLTLFLAINRWSVTQILTAALCTCNGCVLATAGYITFRKKNISSLFSVDAYIFYRSVPARKVFSRDRRNGNILLYLLRHLTTNKSYLMNTGGLWVIACFLPLLLGQFDGLNAMPLGFAILGLNTPICILLSCNPRLEQAVRTLPGQAIRFGSGYCFFIFVVNIMADNIYLISWQLQNGGVLYTNVITAVLFALQSAILSVILEWRYPIRNWKIENDLWHHPRKYIVPLLMLLAAVIVGTRPSAIWVWICIVIVECIGLLVVVRRILK